MSREQLGLVLFAGIFVLAELFECASAQGLQRWRHGVIEPKGDGGFSLMVGQHGFAEKRGLKLEILTLKSGSTAVKALLAGEVDSIEASPGAAILAGAQGADIKIIGCDIPGIPHVLMVHPNIATVQDLRGKVIAVAAPGSLPDLLRARLSLLDKYKIPVSEVRFANFGSDFNRFKAVVAGIADAGVVSSEFSPIAPADLAVLVMARDILPNYLRVCIIMSGKTLANRRAMAIEFVATEMEALHYTLTHRDDTIKLTQETIHTKSDDPRLAYAYDHAIKYGMVDPPASSVGVADEADALARFGGVLAD